MSMTLDEAQRAFYFNPNNQTASTYITEAIQALHDSIPDNDETSTPISPPLVKMISAAAEIAFWLRWGRIEKMPYPNK